MPHATDAGAHRFVVNLMFSDRKTVEVRSCEAIGPNYRNRFTFPNHVSVQDVFVPAMRQGIEQCLSALSYITEVVSLPSVSIEIPGLSLARAHLMATKDELGNLAIIIRFKLLVGSVTQAFRPDLGLQRSVSDHSAHTSALVLADMVMPLLDLCAAVEAGGVKNSLEFDRFVDTLLERADDVRFQAELIKRFVANAPAAPQDAPQNSDPQAISNYQVGRNRHLA